MFWSTCYMAPYEIIEAGGEGFFSQGAGIPNVVVYEILMKGFV